MSLVPHSRVSKRATLDACSIRNGRTCHDDPNCVWKKGEGCFFRGPIFEGPTRARSPDGDDYHSTTFWFGKSRGVKKSVRKSRGVKKSVRKSRGVKKSVRKSRGVKKSVRKSRGAKKPVRKSQRKSSSKI
jgi:hypothetical protein